MKSHRVPIRTDHRFFASVRFFTHSIFGMYSSLSSGTHHIFFQPRPEVVAEKKNPNGFAPDSRNQPLLYTLFSHQSNCPAGIAFRGAGADHRDDALLLAVLQQCGGSGSLLLVKGAIQPALHVSMAQLPNRLGRQRYEFGDTRRAQPFCQFAGVPWRAPRRAPAELLRPETVRRY